MLITMRQALDTPSLATEDNLKFQGLDVSAGAQLMEVIGSEMDHALPLDWPKAYGTVASLAAQAATYVSELQPEKVTGHGHPKVARKDKKAMQVAIEAELKAAEKEKHCMMSQRKQRQQNRKLRHRQGRQPSKRRKTKSLVTMNWGTCHTLTARHFSDWFSK
jgi:hypothetical protein